MASTALAVLTFAVFIRTFPPITCAIHNHGFRGSLTRVHKHSSNYSAAVHRDTRRLAFLAPPPTTSPAIALQALAENGVGAYHVSLSIGTPPLAFPAILDTGSDLLGVARFSYCLRSDAGASPILFGSLANVTTGEGVQSTPLVRNPAVPVPRAPYYYVNLTGVRVGAADLPVTPATFGFTSTGAGGVIVDSGTTFSYIAKAGYAMLERAFLSQTAGLLTRVSGAPFDFDLCFEAADVDAVSVPSLVLSFAGGAEYSVPRRSYFDAVDEEGRVACLLVLPTGGVSVIGNVMQMDLHLLYDLDGGTMSFAPADCATI
ncbi:aspartic proteinase nepenthesin-1-like [Lolium rigidum]|uniref:aspartic proteinase nepenthesin-1-like n=1 Tax=Lolium rigidum TaxID=89674 RepID=UPI001F5D31E3|nr:aspartic proteinase nepenthesin-1-like [Lolium rigidum]